LLLPVPKNPARDEPRPGLDPPGALPGKNSARRPPGRTNARETSLPGRADAPRRDRPARRAAPAGLPGFRAAPPGSRTGFPGLSPRAGRFRPSRDLVPSREGVIPGRAGSLLAGLGGGGFRAEHPQVAAAADLRALADGFVSGAGGGLRGLADRV